MFKMWYFCVYAANCQVFFALFLILYEISFHFHPSLLPSPAAFPVHITSLLMFWFSLCNHFSFTHMQGDANFTYVRGFFFFVYFSSLNFVAIKVRELIFVIYFFFAIKRMKIRRQRKKDFSYKHIITIVVITSYIHTYNYTLCT